MYPDSDSLLDNEQLVPLPYGTQVDPSLVRHKIYNVTWGTSLLAIANAIKQECILAGKEIWQNSISVNELSPLLKLF